MPNDFPLSRLRRRGRRSESGKTYDPHGLPNDGESSVHVLRDLLVRCHERAMEARLRLRLDIRRVQHPEWGVRHPV